MDKIIDAHIHFDQYEAGQQQRMIRDANQFNLSGLISVSSHLKSAQKNLALADMYDSVYPALGYHPEQELPSEAEVLELLSLVDQNKKTIVAIGEVGLPYYLRRKNEQIPLEPYIELLELFLRKANAIDKPVVLHGIYDDAKRIIPLLEKHRIRKAHFHWFKGDDQTLEHMKANGYYISITPDVLYEQEIQYIARKYPLSLMMVETDGPWPFKGPFENKLTHPKMIHKVIEEIAELKGKALRSVYQSIYKNTVGFYSLNNQTRSDC